MATHDDTGPEQITVEVAFALAERQRIIVLQVPRGCTAREAARLSGITREFPDIDLDNADMGIFGKNLDGKLLPLPEAYALNPRERVEIYRPLLVDPKAARQARAAKVKDAKQAGATDAE